MAEAFAEHVILELLGHRMLAGYLTEQEIAGTSFLRLDVPGDPPATQFYSPGAVYAITPTTEEVATRVARGRRPAPVHLWQLEAPRSNDTGTEPPDPEEPF